MAGGVYQGVDAGTRHLKESSLPALGRVGMLRGITVGCGFFGNIHLDGWNRIEDARIVAVVDEDETKASEAADRFGIPHFTDLE